jgi:hypothetical protein
MQGQTRTENESNLVRSKLCANDFKEFGKVISS